MPASDTAQGNMPEPDPESGHSAPLAPARNLLEMIGLIEQLTAVLIAENGALTVLDMDTVRLLTVRKKILVDACAASAELMRADPEAFRQGGDSKANQALMSDPKTQERIAVLARQFELALADNATRLEGTLAASRSWVENLVRQMRDKRHPTTGYGPDGRPR